MLTKITCCKDCQKRSPGCHGKCTEYISQREQRYNDISSERKIKSTYYNAFLTRTQVCRKIVRSAI